LSKVRAKWYVLKPWSVWQWKNVSPVVYKGEVEFEAVEGYENRVVDVVRYLRA